MARERKRAIAPTPAAPEPEVPAPPADSPDVFDQAIAARSPQPTVPATEPQSHATAFADRVSRPDPLAEVTVSLTDDPDGPKARLYRNQRFRQLGIQFDTKPDEAVRQRLREDGWTWRGQDGAWTKQLADRPGLTHRRAEDLFDRLTNDIRRDNGLPPAAGPAQGR